MAGDPQTTNWRPENRHVLMRKAPFLGFTRKHGWVVLELTPEAGAYHTRPGQWRVAKADVLGYAPLPMEAGRD